MLYRLGHVLVYGPLKNTLGFSRIRVAYTAGEAIGSDLFTFYRSLGINLKELYGMTESSVFLCIQKDGEVKSDTVGAPIKDAEIRVAEGGEGREQVARHHAAPIDQQPLMPLALSHWSLPRYGLAYSSKASFSA